ncbi:MAG: hypothetical protein JSS82_12525 [Bacteroidetes bacterium]|nr:hypothetical protein [Bacteroidota bacterium]
MLLTASYIMCQTTPSTMSVICKTNYLLDQLPIVCGNTTYENAATVIGVSKFLNGTEAKYTVELEFTLDFGQLSQCFVSLQWTKVPKQTDVPLCGSLVECRNTDLCLSIVPQNFNYTLDPVTFQRPFDKYVGTMPYEYIMLTRQKSAASSFPLNSNRFADINDDDTDNVNLNGCRRTVCNGTVGAVCGYLGYNSDPAVPAKTQCTSSSTGSFIRDDIAYNNYACSPGYSVMATGANGKESIYSCCATCNYNNNAQSKYYSVFDQSFRQGQASQWRMSISHPNAVKNQLLPNYFSPSVPGEVDNSYSCCANPTCPDTRTGSTKHCNRMSQRFPFPQDPPVTLFGYAGLNVNLLPVNMSNRLQTQTAAALNTNVTNLRPKYTIVSEANFNFQETVDYMKKILNVNFTGANSVAYQNGFWMPVLGAGSDTKDLITNVICAYCGADNPWNSDTSRICNKSNAPGANTTSDNTYGGTYAMKNWVIASSPICTQYTLDESPSRPTIAIPMVIRFGSTSISINSNVKLGSATTRNNLTFSTYCVQCQNVQDPFISGSTNSKSAANNVVYCEPYKGFAATILKTKFSNPWVGLNNPTTGAAGCVDCTPDDFHLTQSEMDKYKIFWYVIPKESAQHFVSYSAGLLNNAGNCRRNLYTDQVLVENNCNDIVPTISLDYGNPGKGFFVTVPPGQISRCQARGSSAVDVGMQSYVCRDPFQTMCRPELTSRSISMYFQQVHAALASNVSKDVAKAKSTAETKGLPKTWDWNRPNFWIGWDSNTTRGGLFYQYNTQDARNLNIFNTISTSLTVPGSFLLPIEQITPVVLSQSALCLCVAAQSTVSGTVLFKVASTATFPTQATYSGTLTLDGVGTKCYVNPSGDSVVVSNNFIIKKGQDTLVSVLCKIGSTSPKDNALLTITLVSTAQPQYVGDSQKFYLPCCTSQTLAIPPATSSNINSTLTCTLSLSTNPIPGRNVINFLNDKCGQSAFSPTPVPTPPTPSVTQIVVTSTYAPPVTLTPSRTPTRTPTRTISPTPTANVSATPGPEEDNGEDTLDQGVMIGIAVAVGAVLLILVVVVVVVVYCCNKQPGGKEKEE